ncbi:DUF5666 domain-containing protein [Helicobacter turcicus]|uniref:DUF5666 domain-containing protein n=1 Tax=Helicobacter turcicus TaxID=2867412 RepID=A0ABS7JM91_9HELI|nr:DUF5666 domain-containing protein [Helicobacter turcicus]MBX7490513.1 hypothetical protein [Helicobacter turcicus]MBX7545372.1 hypothetical protein [Helicobacter turcicus]
MKTLKLFGTLVVAAIFSTSAMADYDFDVHGQISAVDQVKKTITLSGPGGQLVVQVLPYTEIKGDDCGAFGQDIYGSFRDLTVGKFVKVEAVPYGGYNAYNQSNAEAINPSTGLPQNMQLTAKEIEWKCYPRAY